MTRSIVINILLDSIRSQRSTVHERYRLGFKETDWSLPVGDRVITLTSLLTRIHILTITIVHNLL
jgi:hypothetical protein